MKPVHYPAEPASLREHFYRISQIPRPSGQEAAVRRYTIAQAQRCGHHWRTDQEGNLVIAVAASLGMADRPTVIIQNHLDMVTVKAIHAGLECGILKGKKPDMDIFSFRPTIKGAHSPTEGLQLDTVAPFWQFLSGLLAER